VSLFNLEMNVVAEEEVTFLFDICLPKAVVGGDVEGLFEGSRRRVYALEIVVWSVVDCAIGEDS
jgi:hypothetical protein